MSTEKFEGENLDPKITDTEELSEAELAGLGEMYKVGGQNNGASAKAALGAMVLGAAFAASPNEASAQNYERVADSANISVESGKTSVREGVATHPELGSLKIQVFYKKVDPSKPVIGNNYEVQINGVTQNVSDSRFIRNGAGFLEIVNQDGTKGKLVYPSFQDAVRGEKPTYTVKEGDVPLIIK